jgi:hypothetical protein
MGGEKLLASTVSSATYFYGNRRLGPWASAASVDACESDSRERSAGTIDDFDLARRPSVHFTLDRPPVEPQPAGGLFITPGLLVDQCAVAAQQLIRGNLPME